jgi:hypothetical protein
MVRALSIFLICVAGLAQLTGCVVYEPVPVYPPAAPPPATTFDRAWSAALDALQDAGVWVASAERPTGTIRGSKDRTDVLVFVAQQSDGSVRVEIEARALQGEDAGLARRIRENYRRRMGL